MMDRYFLERKRYVKKKKMTKSLVRWFVGTKLVPGFCDVFWILGSVFGLWEVFWILGSVFGLWDMFWILESVLSLRATVI